MWYHIEACCSSACPPQITSCYLVELCKCSSGWRGRKHTVYVQLPVLLKQVAAYGPGCTSRSCKRVHRHLPDGVSHQDTIRYHQQVTLSPIGAPGYFCFPAVVFAFSVPRTCTYKQKAEEIVHRYGINAATYTPCTERAA